MTTKLLIDRELLEQVAAEFEHDNDRYMLGRELRKVLAAPRQPEGDAHKHEAQPEVAQNTGSRSMTNKLSSQGCTGCTGVEGVAAPCETPDAVDIFAWATFDGEGSYDLRLYEDNEGYLDDFRDANPLLHPDWVFPLCRLSDAQRAIAELRGLVPELPPRPPEGEGMPRYGLRWNGPGIPLSVPMDDGYWTPWHLAEAERDTLRRQLADSDAALRESRANDTAAMGHLADMRQQRDLLAGLLRMVRQDGWHHPLEEHEIAQIDAALAEVKPCPESPTPTT